MRLVCQPIRANGSVNSFLQQTIIMTPERQNEIKTRLEDVKRLSDELTQATLAMYQKRLEMSQAFAKALPDGDAEVQFAGSAEGVDVMNMIESTCKGLSVGAEDREKLATDYNTRVKMVVVESILAMAK